MVAPLPAVPLATRVQRTKTWSGASLGVALVGPVRCILAVFDASRVAFKGSRLTKGAAQSGLPFRRSNRVKPGGGRASLSLDDWGRGLLLGG